MARPPHRILLVSPDFHGYWQALARALEHLGCEVVTHRYDIATHRVGLLGNILAHRVPSPKLQAAVDRELTSQAIEALRSARADAVLVVKGDRLTVDWWQALAEQHVRHCVWLYDELANMDYDLGLLAGLERVLSYSTTDVATLQAAEVTSGLLPNAFDSLTPWTPQTIDAVSFIGARYPEREQLLRQLADRGVPVMAWGREWSRHPWDVARTREWRTPGIPTRRDIPRTTYYGVMAGSRATLNIHGRDHNGLSMRTFEAPGVGALGLIDRDEVAQFYEVGTETVVFHDVAEALELLDRAERDPHWAAAISVAGARRTAAEHTFVHRMRTVLDGWR